MLAGMYAKKHGIQQHICLRMTIIASLMRSVEEAPSHIETVHEIIHMFRPIYYFDYWLEVLEVNVLSRKTNVLRVKKQLLKPSICLHCPLLLAEWNLWKLKKKKKIDK